MSLRDRFFTQKVARAITSPSAIVATGAGSAIGLVAFGLGPVGIAGAVGLGLAAWAIRVAAAVGRGPKPDRIDAFALSEPWRSLVQDAVQAQRSYADALRRARPGPLLDRLHETEARLDESVEECWKVAQSGHALSQAYGTIDTAAIERSLATIGSDGRPDDDTKTATVQALEAQLDAAKRMRSTLDNTRSQLELLNARLDEAVTRTIELTTTGSDTVNASTIDSAVAGVTTEMEALRQALETTSQASAI